MDDETRSAALPRWRGAAGRLEVWYATLSDPLTRTGLWVHCETVASSPDRARLVDDAVRLWRHVT